MDSPTRYFILSAATRLALDPPRPTVRALITCRPCGHGATGCTRIRTVLAELRNPDFAWPRPGRMGTSSVRTTRGPFYARRLPSPFDD